MLGESTEVVEAPCKGRRRRNYRPTVTFSTGWITTSSRFSRGRYPLSSRDFGTEYRNNQNLAYPFNYDAEFVVPSHDLDYELTDAPQLASEIRSRMPVTYQIKSTTDYRPFGGSIYASEDQYQRADELGITDQIRHPVIWDDKVVPLEHLKLHEPKVDYWRDVDAHAGDRPLFLLVAYCHFGPADVPLLATGDYQTDLISRFSGDRSQGIARKFEMKRRLSVRGMGGNVSLPWVFRKGTVEYRVGLQVIDTNALHGKASYKALCATAGLVLEAKDYMRETLDENGCPLIEDMSSAYFAHPAEYDAYSLGDLRVSEALEKNVELSRSIYRDLDAEGHFQPPKMSIGSTVADMVTGILAKQFGVVASNISKASDRAAFLDHIVGHAKADHLIRQVYNPSKNLGHVEGGLCRLKIPTTPTVTGQLVDIDLSGAYASRMSQMTFPCGEPVIEHFKGKGKSWALWWRDRRDKLVPGTWIARVSTTALTTYEQDLILSYWGQNNRVEWNAEKDGYDVLMNLDSGNSRSLTREIRDGVVNDTLFEIIDKVFSPAQRKDLLSKLVVTSAAYYPADERVDDSNEWWSIVSADTIRAADRHKWHGLPFGAILIDAIRAIRSKYPKSTPQNLYAKLVGNTLYGDMVSRFFASSNMIFGANITAGVRSAMWATEKGLNLFGSITDGQAFDLERVLFNHPRSKNWATHHFTRLYAMTSRERSDANICRFGPLHPYPETLTDEQINVLALEHLQAQFPTLDFLNAPTRVLDTSAGDGVVRYRLGRGFVRFEMKNRVDRVTVHGSANYLFEHPDGTTTIKMRSYESSKQHYGYRLDNERVLRPVDHYRERGPSWRHLEALRDDPERVELLPPFFKWIILMPGEFAKNYAKVWSNTNLIPGDNFPRAGLLRPFSLSQFMFQTAEQWQTWERTVTRWKAKHGYSLELFFLNDDGTLNYQRMIENVDAAIRNGVVNPIHHFDRSRNLTRDMKRHPERYAIAQRNWDSLNALKLGLAQLCCIDDGGVENLSREEFAYDEIG